MKFVLDRTQFKQEMSLPLRRRRLARLILLLQPLQLQLAFLQMGGGGA